MTAVRHVVVAVPARDEEAVVGACLASVRRAVRHLAGGRPRVSVEVVVALDRCRDATADVVARHGVAAVRCDAGCVGTARASAVDAGLARVRAAGGTETTTWVASTDADGVVPPDWLHGQLALAESGVDLVVGTVEPGDGCEPARTAAWHARHVLAEHHGYVHGANLGVRADAYGEVGGFAPLPLHEDVALVAAVRALGRPWVATDTVRVRTSGRTVGRADGGFASYLAGLPTA